MCLCTVTVIEVYSITLQPVVECLYKSYRKLYAAVDIIFVSHCLANLKANFRLQEGCGLLKSRPVMRGDYQLTNLLNSLIIGVHSIVHLIHPNLRECNIHGIVFCAAKT